MRLLIAEDELDLAEALSVLFEKNQFSVDVVNDGLSAYDYASGGDYDAVILDVMMPGLNGLEVLRRLREEGVKTPVMMLTARGEKDDRITGFDAGADDYLPKPFEPDELIARVRAMLRRGGAYTPAVLTFGDVSLDTGSGLLSCAGQSIRLSGREFQVMELFLRHVRVVLSADRIMERVWGWDSDAETVAANLEAALNLALGIQSPSERVKPVGQNVSAGVGTGMAGYDFTTDAATLAAALTAAVGLALPQNALAACGTAAMAGLALAMTGYSMSATGASVGANVRSAVNASLNGSTLRSAGVNAMSGLAAGINAGRSGVISAMRSAAQAAVSAAKSTLKIKSPSRVFRDEIGAMTMKGFGEGVLTESKAQAKIIRNAARYLTGEAQAGSIQTTSNDNRRTYNSSISSTIQVQQLVVRNEQDIHALAEEIAALTRRQQRGKGMRMA